MIRKKIHKIIFFFCRPKIFTCSSIFTERGRWHGQPVSHLCGWKSIYSSQRLLLPPLSFAYQFFSSEMRIVVASEIVWTLRVRVKVSLRQIWTEGLNWRKTQHTPEQHYHGCVLFCVSFFPPFPPYMYLMLALVLPHWRKYLGFIKYTHVRSSDARSRASKSHKSKHTEFIL